MAGNLQALPLASMPHVNEDPFRPGSRPLVSTEPDMPPGVHAMLRVHGIACNDAGLAVLEAESQFARAADALDRHSADANPATVTGWVNDELHAAHLEHLERLIAIYARTAAQYATLAVEIASAVADGRPHPGQAELAPLPSDVLSLAELHVPRLQIPPSAVRRRWLHRLPDINAELSTAHEHALTAMRHAESTPVAFNDLRQHSEYSAPYLLEADVPATLHEYASQCALAVSIMYASGE
ncbi:hypothetical protein [Dactylosporangium darangshiense]|uniref:Uncharacterized protein n=1 Tax=Dactylosporangium darangshiense TaxID=579108 RepID=A0ABP8DMT4_9ACTN